MKQFNTPENLKPIIKEILNKYTIIKPAANICDFILKSNTSRAAYMFKNKSHYINNIESLDKLINEINDFSEAVETYPGELFDYSQNQKRIVLNTITTLLYHEYQLKNTEAAK